MTAAEAELAEIGAPLEDVRRRSASGGSFALRYGAGAALAVLAALQVAWVSVLVYAVRRLLT